MSAIPTEPFNPDDDFDAIADFARREVAKVALRVTRYEAYKRAAKSDQVQGYIAGMMVGALGSIVAVTTEGADEETRALLRKHFDYWFNVALAQNDRPPLGGVQ